MLRAVLDSNVVLASDGAVNPLSPNKEILHRWSVGEFIWLITADIAAEYAEKLLDKGNAPSDVEDSSQGSFFWQNASKSDSSTSGTIQLIPTILYFFSAPSMVRRHILSAMTVTLWM